MSTTTERTNIEAVRRLYDAFARRDMTAAADTMAADIQWHESDELPWGGTHTRPPAVTEHIFRASLQTIPDLAVTPRHILACGDSVAALHHYTGTGLYTHRNLNIPGIGVFDLRKGRITRYRQFVDAKEFTEILLAQLAGSQIQDQQLGDRTFTTHPISIVSQSTTSPRDSRTRASRTQS